MNLSELGEFGFIETLRGWAPTVDTDDDAAVVELDGVRLAFTTDALVDGIHFRTDWSDPIDIGWKAVSVNVSDLAATGAAPRWLLIALCAPPDTSAKLLQGIYRGVADACGLYGCAVVGGDTVRSDQLVLSVTAVGSLEGEPLRRSGAKVGDVLAVTGPLGRAATGVNLLLSKDPKGIVPEDGVACMDAHRRPVARVEEGLRLARGVAHAAIDISDGLASDAIHLAEASGLGVEIDSLPVADEVVRIAEARGWDAEAIVLGGGEDFELLVALPSDQVGNLIPVGCVTAEGAVLVRDGERVPLASSGFDHFHR